MNPLMKIVCGNCGSEATPDKDQSTGGWIYYKINKPCENCGNTQWEMKWIEDGGAE